MSRILYMQDEYCIHYDNLYVFFFFLNEHESNLHIIHDYELYIFTIIYNISSSIISRQAQCILSKVARAVSLFPCITRYSAVRAPSELMSGIKKPAPLYGSLVSLLHGGSLLDTVHVCLLQLFDK